jgi:GNAT superfamily N-acetyltransferase
VIRLRQTDDLDEIQELDRRCFPTDVGLKGPQFLDSVWWVAEVQAVEAPWVPIGYAGLYPELDQNKAFLTRAGVVKEARGRGLQQRLIRARVACAKRLVAARVYTYVAVANMASARNLIKCGFLPYTYERLACGADGDMRQTFVYYEKHLTR